MENAEGRQFENTSAAQVRRQVDAVGVLPRAGNLQLPNPDEHFPRQGDLWYLSVTILNSGLCCASTR
jgi:hypothetical protein